MSREPSVPKERASTEEGTIEANPSQTQKVDASVRVENPQDAGSAPSGVIDITESPSFTDSMFGESQAAKERSNEGVQGANDPLKSFFDSVDSITTEDVTVWVVWKYQEEVHPRGHEDLARARDWSIDFLPQVSIPVGSGRSLSLFHRTPGSFPRLLG